MEIVLYATKSKTHTFVSLSVYAVGVEATKSVY